MWAFGFGLWDVKRSAKQLQPLCLLASDSLGGCLNQWFGASVPLGVRIWGSRVLLVPRYRIKHDVMFRSLTFCRDRQGPCSGCLCLIIGPTANKVIHQQKCCLADHETVRESGFKDSASKASFGLGLASCSTLTLAFVVSSCPEPPGDTASA